MPSRAKCRTSSRRLTCRNWSKRCLSRNDGMELRLLPPAPSAPRRPAPAPAASAHAAAPATPAHAAAQGKTLLQEGQRLYGEQCFSEAAERWGWAALLQHGPSHAHLSNMLIEGRPGVAKDEERAFEFATAGAALGCAHSKGALGRCYVMGYCVASDAARGLALGRENEAAGSCFGQFVVGVCYNYGYGGVAKDDAEAVRLYRLAAEQGLALAQFNLGFMFENDRGVAKDRTEAIRLYRLAAAQGRANATAALKRLGA
jgi:TPR repeat protein